MTQVKTIQNTQPKMKRDFIGRGWINTVKQGPRAGLNFIQVKFDRGVEIDKLTPDCMLQLWPNEKREGKRDADYRLSILTPEQAIAQA